MDWNNLILHAFALYFYTGAVIGAIRFADDDVERYFEPEDWLDYVAIFICFVVFGLPAVLIDLLADDDGPEPEPPAEMQEEGVPNPREKQE